MRENSKNDKIFHSVIRGGTTSIIITLVAIIVFAFIIKFAYLNSGVIKAVNQFIKTISVFLGCFCFVRESKGLIKGALIGCFSAIITYLIFALIGGTIDFGISFILDVIFQVILGAIFGVVAVNIKK